MKEKWFFKHSFFGVCLISYNTDQYVFLKSYYLLGCRADTGFLFSVFLFKRSCNLVPIVCNGLETLFPWAFVQLICKHLLKMLTKEKNFNLRTSWEVSQHTNMFKTGYSTLKNHRNRSVSSQMFSKNGIWCTCKYDLRTKWGRWWNLGTPNYTPLDSQWAQSNQGTELHGPEKDWLDRGGTSQSLENADVQLYP